VSLAPARRLTFPDQQQNLQNAAHYSLASECDGNVKFPHVCAVPAIRPSTNRKFSTQIERQEGVTAVPRTAPQYGAYTLVQSFFQSVSATNSSKISCNR